MHGGGPLPGRPGAEAGRTADAHGGWRQGLLPAPRGGGLRALLRGKADRGSERDPYLHGQTRQRRLPKRPGGGEVL